MAGSNECDLNVATKTSARGSQVTFNDFENFELGLKILKNILYNADNSLKEVSDQFITGNLDVPSEFEGQVRDSLSSLKVQVDRLRIHLDVVQHIRDDTQSDIEAIGNTFDRPQEVSLADPAVDYSYDSSPGTAGSQQTDCDPSYRYDEIINGNSDESNDFDEGFELDDLLQHSKKYKAFLKKVNMLLLVIIKIIHAREYYGYLILSLIKGPKPKCKLVTMTLAWRLAATLDCITR